MASELLLHWPREYRGGNDRELFFVLSGEHSSLPAAEISAILDSEGVKHSHECEDYRLLSLTSPTKALKLVSDRSLMYDWCGLLLGESAAKPQEIDSLIRAQSLGELTEGARNFAVRSIRIGGRKDSIDRMSVEREVGSILKEVVPRLQVELERPELTFVCIIHGSKFLFGLSAFEKPGGLVAPRLPRRRPAFHPSTMPPKIARCMVNLARARTGAVFVDPFCGVGGILIEAAVIGCNVVGVDANSRMLRGARSNMKHFHLGALGFVNSDARYLPLEGGVEAIATDPPYGRGSSTMGVKTSNLIREFLEGAANLLTKHGHLCIAAPKEVELERYASDAGFTLIEQHLVRVHRSLTRRLAVLKGK